MQIEVGLSVPMPFKELLIIYHNGEKYEQSRSATHSGKDEGTMQ
jgi:hypothetical protein